MPRSQLESPVITSEADLERVPYPLERKVGKFLLENFFPKYIFAYEPTVFEREGGSKGRCEIDENGRKIKRATVPDYPMVNMENGQEVIIEVYGGVITEDFDPKERHKALMAEIEPEVPYIVLDLKRLATLDDKYPGYNFREDYNTWLNSHWE